MGGGVKGGNKLCKQTFFDIVKSCWDCKHHSNFLVLPFQSPSFGGRSPPLPWLLFLQAGAPGSGPGRAGECPHPSSGPDYKYLPALRDFATKMEIFSCFFLISCVNTKMTSWMRRHDETSLAAIQHARSKPGSRCGIHYTQQRSYIR